MTIAIEKHTSNSSGDSELNLHASFKKLSSITEPIEFYNQQENERYLNYLTNESYTYAHEATIKTLVSPITKFKNSRIVKNLGKLLLSLTNQSLKFGARIHEMEGIQVLIDIVTDKNLIGILSKTIECKQTIFNSVELFLKYILGSLHNLAKISPKYMNLWRNADSVNRLIDLSNKVNSLVSIKNVCYITVALLATDKEIENLQEITEVTAFLTKTINKCVLQYLDPLKILRTEIQLNDDNVYHSIISVSAHGILWSLTELVQALYALAINDSIKKDIYFRDKINEAIKKIIFNGNEKEVEIGFKLLWQLSFDETVLTDVSNNAELLEKIRSFKNSSNKEIVQNVDGLLWLMEKNLKITPNLDEQKGIKMREKSIVKNKYKHVMISYNRDSRDLCLKIKKDLEKDGHKIWIDVENIHGSSLEAMAKAIEESQCVLMCMTEKYKQSSNCRAEAEYAFQLNKPIIPLIMQQNYKPDGWLGIILGSKIFVNFTKYEYDECLKRVIHEIKEQHGANLIEKPPKEEVDQANSQPVTLDWSHTDIEKWFEDKKLNKTILKELHPMNGRLGSSSLERLKLSILPAFLFFSVNIDKKLIYWNKLYLIHHIWNYTRGSIFYNYINL
ncbi:hypothetical protein BpHYR1_043720 [Brachionus plicatilis]|uniref:TIR domain-containing protein n=1 Tax=Brachionus plicatilis TaxID=10195 RepID=A0A3M7PQ08_BRAPC|nr:hypothetical protein BpHYR1_043720 [Brachionus plicatilis]